MTELRSRAASNGLQRGGLGSTLERNLGYDGPAFSRLPFLAEKQSSCD